ncbi:MAG: hypothetical protein ABR947_04915 [Solirubrobacteraceae bacterium]|jgi:hypothetical protein
MDPSRSRRRAQGLLAGAAAMAALAAGALHAGHAAGSSAAAAVACGERDSAAAVAAVDAATANHIYGNELAGTEVSFDLAQITGATDLLAAVAADNRAAALAAVSRLVYHPAWHIVRLRALDASGQILADVGGPDVIAPVSGPLIWHGRTVGSFVMSVQDDTGFTKLETRYVGDPIGIYFGGALVAERYAQLPAAPPSGPTLSLGGTEYGVVTETYSAFPNSAVAGAVTGQTLTAAILVPPPAVATASLACTTVRADEFGRIAERFARLAVSLPEHYPGFARTVHTYTAADVFVRAGSTQLASTAGPGPATLPTAGTVSYEGSSWLVFSFEPAPSTRVYVLAPPE